MKYRAEIDGLRAIAVITVIFFHAGFKYFDGGFIGVDVFLVISGYLITTIILTEMEHGTFSLVNFYERRFRRIIPPLFLVMIASSIYAWFWLLPADMREFSQSLVSVSTFSSNILFWRTSNYWDTASELKPLLHTWSLAVEEQYYLLFPPFLILLWRFGKRWLPIVIIALMGTSLAYAQWGAYNKPIATFYLLPTRVWELAIGVGIAFCFLYKKEYIQNILSNKQLNEFLSLLGLFMIGYAVFFFNKNTPFPSMYALVPTIGTGLIIVFSSAQTIIGRMLSTKPFVATGLISYSAYLWHQPLFAFARQRGATETNKLTFAALVLLNMLLAYISWKFVEKPFRDKSVFGRRIVFSLAAIGSITFILLGLLGRQYNGFEDRFTDEQKKILAFNKYEKSEIYREETCFLNDEQTFENFSAECFYSGSERNTIFIWGDSHAAALSYGIRENHLFASQLTSSGCLPLIGYNPVRRPYCQGINSYAIKKIGELKPKFLLLHANWSEPLNEIDDGLYQSLSNTILAIQEASPQTETVIIGGVPQWKPSLPNLLVLSRIKLSEESFVYSSSYSKIENSDQILESVAKSNNIKFISLLDIYCKESKCLSAANQGDGYEPFAWDYGHLTKSSSLLVSKKILSLLKISSQ